MTAAPIGVGVDGTLPSDWIAAFANLAEASGYGSFWYSVRPGPVDPFVTLRGVVERTDRVPIGISAFPLDAYPAADVARRLADARLALERIIVGVAAGQAKRGALHLVEGGVAALRAALPGARVGVGAIGPQMLALAGRVGDAVLVNWLTPERLAWSREQVASGARGAGRLTPDLYLYHRAARGADGLARIQAEMAIYRQWPVHKRHQAAMGRPSLIGVAADDPTDVAQHLGPYLSECTLILRPLPGDVHDKDEWESLIQFFAPGAARG